MKTCLGLLAFILIISCNTKEKIEKTDFTISIDSVVQALADTAGFNGNVLISRNGAVVYQKSAGYANYYTREQLNDSSVFELASVSKQFTAMAIMMLKEQGLLKFEDDVTQHLPELPYKGMTIRHFLTHTSGIPDYMELFEEHWDSAKIAFNSDIIDLLAKHKPKPLFAPGEKWEYSNTAYALLASIVERVSGQSFADFLKSRIFDPLHMQHSRIYNTRRSQKEIIPNYAFGFIYADSLKEYILPDSASEYYYVTILDGIQGDGVVNSTTGDLFKWDQALYTEQLVKGATLQEAFTPVKLKNDSTFRYGFGWGIDRHERLGKVVSHSGGWPGYGTFIKRFIDRKDCIIILSNNGGSGRGVLLTEIEKRL